MERPPHWNDLSDGAKQNVAYIVHLLANNFSGKIVIVCQEGGVRDLSETRSLRSSDLKRLLLGADIDS